MESVYSWSNTMKHILSNSNKMTFIIVNVSSHINFKNDQTQDLFNVIKKELTRTK